MKLFTFNLRLSIRNVIRFKKYSLLNILGLSIGMATTIIILLWVYYELSFDRYHKKIDNLYRVVQDQYYSGRDVFHVTVTSTGVYHVLKEEFPEIEHVGRYNNETFLVQHGDKKFVEQVHLVDPEYLLMFSNNMLKGNLETALNDPHSIILTDETAKKFFGEEDPIGKMITLNSKYAFTVTGIIEKPPSNSHMWFNYLIPFTFYEEIGVNTNLLGNNFIRTYVELSDKHNLKQFNEKMHAYQEEKYPDDNARHYLQPVKDIHLKKLGGGGSIENVRLFTLIAMLILIVASINFINLTTAMAAQRYREIGMKKVLGSGRGKLISQFLSETMVIAVVSFLIALILVELALPLFNRITGKEIMLNFFDWRVILGLVLVTMMSGALSGLYPSIYMSSFNSLAIMKGGLSGSSRSRLRQFLVVLQFSLAMVLITNTIVIKNQQEYMQKMELGINKENVIYLPLRGALNKHFATVKEELLTHPDIKSVSFSNHIPTSIYSNSGGFNWKGKTEDTNPLVTNTLVDFDYAETFDLKIIEGSFFPNKRYHDSNAVVINKTFADIIGIEPILHEPLEVWNKTYTIIGVVDDYHFKPLSEQIEPMVMYSWADYRYMFIRVYSEDYPNVLSDIEDIHNKFNPAYPFEYHFLDDEYNRLYKNEEQRSQIIGFFSIIAIFISCLGLYGLSSFIAIQKTKEIGIRKSNGAQVKDILQMFNRYFSKWILVAFILATPVSYYFMNRWLQNYAYNTNLEWHIFAISGAIAYIIALLTIGWQSWKAATKNPIDSLRYE